MGDGCSATGRRLLDVGGEYDPGRAPPPSSADEELRRVRPVIAGLAGGQAAGVRSAIDTTKAAVAEAALAAGAAMVNDITASAATPDARRWSPPPAGASC